jgi:hypothetical protein
MHRDREENSTGSGALLHRAGEVLAILDELAQQAEYAAGAGLYRRAVGCRTQRWGGVIGKRSDA